MKLTSRSRGVPAPRGARCEPAPLNLTGGDTMRWIIRLAIFAAVLTAEGLVINACIEHATTNYQHTFWGRRG